MKHCNPMTRVLGLAVLCGMVASYAWAEEKEEKYPRKVEFTGTISVEKDDKDIVTGATFAVDGGEKYMIEMDSKGKKIAKKYEASTLSVEGSLVEKRVRVKEGKKTKSVNQVFLKIKKYKEAKADADAGAEGGADEGGDE